MCVAVNSHACYIWTVNDITDFNTYFCFSFLSFIIFQNGMCKEVCVCVAINSHACCIWIVNDITDSNTYLFSVSGFLPLFWNCMCKEVCMCVYVCVVVNHY